MTISLTSFLARIRARYDIESFTVRHTDAILLDRVSDAWMRAMEAVSDVGCDDVLLSTTATSGAGATTNMNGTIVSVSATVPCRRIHTIDYYLSGAWEGPLERVANSEQVQYSGTGSPLAWCEAGHDATRIASGGTEIGTLRFMLLPATDQAYTLRIRYLPVITLASTDSITADENELAWIEREVGVYLAERDHPTNQVILADRRGAAQQAHAQMIRSAVSRSGLGGTKIQNTRLRRLLRGVNIGGL